jgi:hypothetical protein
MIKIMSVGSRVNYPIKNSSVKARKLGQFRIILRGMLDHCRRRQWIFSKRREQYAQRHGVISQKN